MIYTIIFSLLLIFLNLMILEKAFKIGSFFRLMIIQLQTAQFT